MQTPSGASNAITIRITILGPDILGAFFILGLIGRPVRKDKRRQGKSGGVALNILYEKN